MKCMRLKEKEGNLTCLDLDSEQFWCKLIVDDKHMARFWNTVVRISSIVMEYNTYK